MTQVHPALDSKVLDDDDGKLPWIIKNEYRERIEDAVNCILVPSGHGDAWQRVDIFSATGNIRGTFLIRIILSLMELILSLVPKYPVAYKAFHLILSKDAVDLMRPDHDTSEVSIERLFNRVAETVALHEGCYPESESTFGWHQALHLPTHIPVLGPLNNQSSLGGERALPGVKKEARGGRKYEEYTIAMYSQVERRRMRELYTVRKADLFNVRSVPEDLRRIVRLMNDPAVMSYNKTSGKLEFTQHRVSLGSFDSRTFELNQYEWSGLLVELSAFSLQYQCRGDPVSAIRTSVVFRICYAHEFQLRLRTGRHHVLSELRYRENIAIWLSDLASFMVDGSEEVHNLANLQAVHGLFIDGDTADDDEQQIVHAVHSGSVYRSDLVAMQSLLSRRLCAFNKADIFGVQFKGRGQECREREYPRFLETFQPHQRRMELARPNNRLSNLSERYHLSVEYSSWCKVRRPGERNDVVFAQFNAFFTVSCPEDPTIDGVRFGSVTARKHFTTRVIQGEDLVKVRHDESTEGGRDKVRYKPTKDDPNLLYHVPADDLWSFDHSTLFVPLVSIYATPLLVLPFYVAGFDMNRRTDHKWPSEAFMEPIKVRNIDDGKKRRRYAEVSANDVTHLTLLEMYPERSDVRFEESMWNYYCN